MKTFARAAALAAALAVAPLVSAGAEPLPGGEIHARGAGGEFRGYGTTPRNTSEDVIWRLAPDGSVASISLFRRRSGRGGQFEEYRDIGVWRVEGDRLCVEFRGAHSYFSGCYAVDGEGGDHVRLVGPLLLRGTLSR
jgi:hypothetical protein